MWHALTSRSLCISVLEVAVVSAVVAALLAKMAPVAVVLVALALAVVVQSMMEQLGRSLE